MKTSSSSLYKAFGLNVFSEISFPELPVVNLAENTADVLITFKDLNEKWETYSSPDDLFFISSKFILFNLPEVGIFLIEKGKEIFVSPFKGVQEDQLRLYLLGTCMGAVLMQRGILPLHGSALEINGKAYAIVGDSGAGKSTTASALLKTGYRLISDDVIPVTLTEDNIPMAVLAYPQQKLWQESLTEFGMDSSSYRPVVDRETKFAVPVHAQFAAKPLPLAGIFELVITEKEDVDIRPIEQLERLHKLYYHTYRNFFLKPAGLMEWHFRTCTAMVNKLDLYQLQRPKTRFTADELTALILSSINKEVIV
ncbi:aldolase [Evansella sp. LMS18]|uniref:aldolase n=1 Tax=Evansella sp. LMS18 TaxID=2924033 RepID=UPI0020D1B448|nr:aldolase [Evansella sp. LMS18]UTR13077.1 aldolase [Evansella sp. LMS18]